MSNIYQAKGKTLRAQYEDVGRLFAKNLQTATKLNKKKLLIARDVLRRVQTETKFRKFYDCFSSWARGGGISETVAMYKMLDNMSGCQTLIVRYQSGVALLHTEEDFENIQKRMQGVHTIRFNDRGRILNTLVYNDLMPGAGLYGWQKNRIVAVDSLFLREDGIVKFEKPMLANIVAWMVWQVQPGDEPEKVMMKMRRLGEVVDGYAINVVQKRAGKIEGYKLTFARGDWEVERLGDQIGAYLAQVNIIEPRYVRAKKPIAVWRYAPWKMVVDYRGFLHRLRVMREYTEKYKHYLQITLSRQILKSVHLTIHKTIFRDLRKDLINKYMGAMCVGIIDKGIGMSVSCKLNDQKALEVVEYIDLV